MKNKIKAYRKKIGMSQETLSKTSTFRAKQLMPSRIINMIPH